ncbi:MAG: hypothetical protein ACO1PM_18310 [Acidovorax sp.]
MPIPESHAASFAVLVYASCWLNRHEPAAFLVALLNSQLMASVLLGLGLEVGRLSCVKQFRREIGQPKLKRVQ